MKPRWLGDHGRHIRRKPYERTKNQTRRRAGYVCGFGGVQRGAAVGSRTGRKTKRYSASPRRPSQSGGRVMKIRHYALIAFCIIVAVPLVEKMAHGSAHYLNACGAC